MEGKYDLRYLVHYTQASEIPGRIEYLYDIFHIYFIMQNQIGDYIPLVPIGHLDFNALFISGHANYVMQFLEQYIEHVPETIIVATTCLAQHLVKYKRIKRIYIPKSSGDYCYIYDGTPFGFSFDITDVELNLYNSSGDIITRIQSSYRLL